VKFGAYQLAKSDCVGQVKVLTCSSSATAQDAEQAAVWKKLVENTLEPPETWEVALSAGKDKRENFGRLLCEGNLSGLTCC
jgi:60 kDa SS-A/Ro ribonucleoprotein